MKLYIFLVEGTVHFFNVIFSDLDPDFWLIRIQTQEKKPIQIQEKKSGSETLDESNKKLNIIFSKNCVST